MRSLLLLLFFQLVCLQQFAQVKTKNLTCGDYALANATSNYNHQQIPKFFDAKKTYEVSTGTNVYIKPIFANNTNATFKGTLKKEKDTLNYSWQNVLDYTFSKEGVYFLELYGSIGNQVCKTFTKKIVVKKDTVSLNRAEPFCTELNIGTGLKYYPEMVTNKNVFRDGYWQLVSGPIAAIGYPTYGWTMLGVFSPDIVGNAPQRFEGVHWLTLSSVFNSSANNMYPQLPYVFEKQFLLKESDTITIDLTTLYDNHMAFFIDNKRLYLEHPIAAIEELVNKENLNREEVLERRETFNFSYNASFIKKGKVVMPMKAGVHKIKIELRSASQEIGFITKGYLHSTTGKKNNFQPLGFVMTDLIKGANWQYEKTP